MLIVKMSAIRLFLLGLTLSWISTSTSDNSHSIWITRMEPEFSKEWIAEDFKTEIKKANKNEKVVNITLTYLKDFAEDIMCEVKVYQQMGGKYLKAPADFPRKSCCSFMENNTDIWSCVMKFSNLPRTCPITKGTYHIKDFNANKCEIDFQLPPHLPENYKVEFQSFDGSTRLFKMVAYGTMKRKIRIF